MNYEKIILELMSRIQTLEEQMAELLNERNSAGATKSVKVRTEDIRQYIARLKEIAKKNGEEALILRSGDIHRNLNLKNAMPQVCNAMRQSMNKGDVELHTTDSGYSSTIEIQYFV